MKIASFTLLFILSTTICAFAQTTAVPTPPMGWNSYNSYGATVTEAEVKANADFMAAHLRTYGWEYIVVDYCWFYPYPGALNNPPQNESFSPPLAMDRYGRLLPALDRFPSAANGRGFRPLADYIHSKGLKFGIHVMRGIPRQAVAQNTPVLGSNQRAQDIADTSSVCGWLNSMYGVNIDKDGAQQYYDSLLKLYASWGVDYIKVDDLLYIVTDAAGAFKGAYHLKEIEAVEQAIKNCGREIVFSISPGDKAPVEEAEFLKQYANLWRISEDFWDEWESLKHQFELCAKWSPSIGANHWPDADMLQLGRLSRRGPNGAERDSRFTSAEQITHMTLWCIFRSPLMFGGDLTMIMPSVYQLITNREVLEVNQNSSNNRQLFRRGNHVAWIAAIPGSSDIYLALFNLGQDSETPVYVLLKDAGIDGYCQVRDLWAKKEIGEFNKAFYPVIPAHGAGLYRLSPR